jgi:hypothetical protein
MSDEPERTRVCANCRFYFEGECRRYPRQVVESVSSEDWASGTGPVAAPKSDTFYFFPKHDKDDWCGEFQGRFSLSGIKKTLL